MKKSGLLNSRLSALIAALGHTEQIAVVDSGFPLPAGVQVVDLAVTKGIPCFLEVLNAVLLELGIEKAFIAEEMKDQNRILYDKLNDGFKDQLIIVKHTEFKEMSRKVTAIIRTGEYKPFSNIILESGVEFL